VQRTTDALHDLDIAKSKVDEQRAIAANPDQADAIRKRFEDERRGMGAAHDELTVQGAMERSRFNQHRGQTGANEIDRTMSTLRGQLEEMQRGRALMSPGGVLSDQRDILFRNHLATSRASLGGAEGAKGQAELKLLADQVGNARMLIDAGRETFNRDGLSDGEKRAAEAHKVEREAADKAIAEVQKELVTLEKQRGEALKVVAEETRTLNALETKRSTKKAEAEADQLEADNKDRERAAKEKQGLDDQVKALRETTAHGERRMMSPKEHAQALRQQLAEAFGMPVGSSGDVQSGLAKLRKQADEARARGDSVAEKAALEKLDDAQGLAMELGGLGAGGKKARVAGEGTSAIGVLLGSSGNNLVLDESKRHTQELEKIRSALESIDRKTGTDTLGAFDSPFNLGL
jgi:hypothetical protein